MTKKTVLVQECFQYFDFCEKTEIGTFLYWKNAF